jgi:hypothetical protein
LLAMWVGEGVYEPRRDHVNATTVVMRRAAEGVHYSSDSPFGALVLHSAWAIEESRAGADEGEASVLLRWRGTFGAVLLDESVEGEFGGVEGAVEVYVDCFEVWGLGRVFGTCVNASVGV